MTMLWIPLYNALYLMPKYLVEDKLGLRELNVWWIPYSVISSALTVLILMKLIS